MNRPLRRLALLAAAVLGLLTLPSCIHHHGRFRPFPFPHYTSVRHHHHHGGSTRVHRHKAPRRARRANRASRSNRSSRPRRGHRR